MRSSKEGTANCRKTSQSLRANFSQGGSNVIHTPESMNQHTSFRPYCVDFEGIYAMNPHESMQWFSRLIRSCNIEVLLFVVTDLPFLVGSSNPAEKKSRPRRDFCGPTVMCSDLQPRTESTSAATRALNSKRPQAHRGLLGPPSSLFLYISHSSLPRSLSLSLSLGFRRS
jgi:hypothetical protein